MTRTLGNAGVVGLGTMGAGIVEVLARSGIDVVAVESDADALGRGRAAIEASVERAVKGEKLTLEQADALRARVTYATDIATLAGAGIVIEAVPENLDLKRSVLAALDDVVAADAILATNTSSLPVTELAVSTAHPSRVVGLHFFNPAPVQAFVEVVSTVVSSPDVVEDVVTFAGTLGKEPVVVGDRAGFIANALLFGYLNHAMAMLEAKYATREDLDAAMRYGCGYPMGPLALLDLIGLDTAYEILDSMYRQGRDRLHAPSPLLKQMVSAGLLGRKSGRGFYSYERPGSSTVVPDAATPSKGEHSGAPARTIERVGVVGSGTMAIGIVEAFALGGLPVLCVARSQEKVDGVLAAVRGYADKMVEKERLTRAAADELVARVSGTTTREDLAEADLIVEAVAEDLAIKQDLFVDLDRIAKPGAVLATTTSSLPIIDCAKVTSRPGDVIGMHFFNPAAIMKLVEVVATVSTEADVVATALAVCERLGKVPVTCSDRSGFIVNALLFPYLNDAIKMLEANYASADDIDLAMTAGCSLPMGPFQLLDVVGLDVSLAIERELYTEFREPGYAPAPLLEHLVTAGYLGRKTKRGFRTY